MNEGCLTLVLGGVEGNKRLGRALQLFIMIIPVGVCHMCMKDRQLQELPVEIDVLSSRTPQNALPTLSRQRCACELRRSAQQAVRLSYLQRASAQAIHSML